MHQSLLWNILSLTLVQIVSLGLCKLGHVLRFASSLRDQESQHDKVEDNLHARMNVVANGHHLLLRHELVHISGILPGAESRVEDQLQDEVDGEHGDHD